MIDNEREEAIANAAMWFGHGRRATKRALRELKELKIEPLEAKKTQETDNGRDQHTV